MFFTLIICFTSVQLYFLGHFGQVFLSGITPKHSQIPHYLLPLHWIAVAFYLWDLTIAYCHVWIDLLFLHFYLLFCRVRLLTASCHLSVNALSLRIT